MIKNVTVTNHLGESMTMELRRPEQSGFLINDIDGLGPSKASINKTDIPAGDGAIYNSAQLASRNIIFNFTFLGSSIEDTRQKSYKYFPIKKRVELQFETDNRICQTFGYVESNEPNIFSAEEGSSISIICTDPFLYSIETNITLFSGVGSNFEFPFENLSLSTKLMELSTLSLATQKSVYYEGDAAVGVVIYIHSIGTVTNLQISNTRTHELMQINTTKLAALTGFGIIAGDDIIISTVKGNKFVYLQRNGILINILNSLEKNADWFTIEPGDNLFSYIAASGISYLQFRIENQTIFEGV